jgi:hypothetical protein
MDYFVFGIYAANNYVKKCTESLTFILIYDFYLAKVETIYKCSIEQAGLPSVKVTHDITPLVN